MDHGKIGVVLCGKIDPIAQLVHLNHQDLRSNFPTRMMPLDGSGLNMEGDHLNIKIVAALFFIMPTYYLYVEKSD